MTNEMTPQQQRIFTLQATRNWGPFTEAEQQFMADTLKSSKKQMDSPFQFPVRVLSLEETLDNIKTIPMAGE